MRLLGPPLTDAEQQALFDSAMALLGTPWKHKGRMGFPYGRQTGLDCLGAVKRVLLDAGRPTEDRERYPRTSDGSDLLATLDAWLGQRVPAAAVGPFHVVHIPFGQSRQHVGVTLPRDGDTYLWHSYNESDRTGSVMWHRLDAQWRDRINAGWAL